MSKQFAPTLEFSYIPEQIGKWFSAWMVSDFSVRAEGLRGLCLQEGGNGRSVSDPVQFCTGSLRANCWGTAPFLSQGVWRADRIAARRAVRFLRQCVEYLLKKEDFHQQQRMRLCHAAASKKTTVFTFCA